MKKIISYFLQGLLYTVPLAVSIYVLVVSFLFLDNLIPIDIPGIGLLVILVLVTIVGFFGQLIITKPIYTFFDGLLKKAPLIKIVYSAVKDLLSAFVGKEKKFRNPVLVKINEQASVERLGFITEKDLSELGIENKIAVYLPSSYGVLGELIIVPKENVKPLDVHPAEIMKFIVSGGVTKM
ncbi:MAG: DUF502 domain-containing protein [Bacteroidetes bacterium]|jgi:uncharacterized membrane protein|nr:DUF502 domain-containing protein [Bacteroidota bacterium]MBT6685610.1 DUF502 domain-containing protein [Bacteroidota bacterium]MBT7144710.1 DUF502 domain-containing protein [Bacteroidota bacterium]MBT7490090.1 DUF502 domain-containing protein [Bacteroidota bacterium]